MRGKQQLLNPNEKVNVQKEEGIMDKDWNKGKGERRGKEK